MYVQQQIVIVQRDLHGVRQFSDICKILKQIQVKFSGVRYQNETNALMLFLNCPPSFEYLVFSLPKRRTYNIPGSYFDWRRKRRILRKDKLSADESIAHQHPHGPDIRQMTGPKHQIFIGRNSVIIFDISMKAFTDSMLRQ